MPALAIAGGQTGRPPLGAASLPLPLWLPVSSLSSSSLPLSPNAARALPRTIGKLALRSLHEELVLYPKPGLVSLQDNGSHHDMTAATFMQSLFSLRHAFVAFAAAGMQAASFGMLRQIGIDAELRMLRATRGINTHRGAIFCLGMLCAAMGRVQGAGDAMTPHAIRAVLLENWGDDLQQHAAVRSHVSHRSYRSHSTHLSNGERVAALYGSSGAGSEASAGFPAVFEHGLPALRAALEAGRDEECARIDALFALMACVSDTNVLHRGGMAGARLVRHHAEKFLAAGGSAHPDWRSHALACHREFVAHQLSPGGAADLLAACCLVHHATAGAFPRDDLA
jgi:triphosphoribosyl-dephospho-CoA synthase